MIRRVKIGVIADPRRQFHDHILLRVKNYFAKPRVIAQNWCIGRKKVLKDLTSLPPRVPSQPQKGIQRVFREYFLVVKFRGLKMSELFQRREINNQITD